MPGEQSKNLTKKIEEVIELLSLKTNELTSLASEMSSLKTEVTLLRDSLSEVARIVLQGNGRQSLLTRVALLEQEIEESKEDKKISLKGRWQVWVALIAAVGGLLSVLLA